MTSNMKHPTDTERRFFLGQRKRRFFLSW